MNIETLFSYAFKIAIGLAITGGLAKATLHMAQSAFEAQSHMISLGKFSRSLQSGGKPRSNHP